MNEDLCSIPMNYVYKQNIEEPRSCYTSDSWLALMCHGLYGWYTWSARQKLGYIWGNQRTQSFHLDCTSISILFKIFIFSLDGWMRWMDVRWNEQSCFVLSAGHKIKTIDRRRKKNIKINTNSMFRLIMNKYKMYVIWHLNINIHPNLSVYI